MDKLLMEAEIFFRMQMHAVVPLHQALVTTICAGRTVPLELATALEDLGQAYVGLAGEVNAELRRRGAFKDDPEADEVAEARIEAFVTTTVEQLGSVMLRNGSVIDGRQAVAAFPAATYALRAALLAATRVQAPTVPGAPRTA